MIKFQVLELRKQRLKCPEESGFMRLDQNALIGCVRGTNGTWEPKLAGLFCSLIFFLIKLISSQLYCSDVVFIFKSTLKIPNSSAGVLNLSYKLYENCFSL